MRAPKKKAEKSSSADTPLEDGDKIMANQDTPVEKDTSAENIPPNEINQHIPLTNLGMFEVTDESLDDPKSDGIHIEPVRNKPIPEEQRKVRETIYSTLATLKYLKTNNAFSSDKQFGEFRKRLVQIAKIGLEGEYVYPGIAESAMDNIREEIAIRVGKSIKIQYLRILGRYCLVLAALFAVLGSFTNYVLGDLAGLKAESFSTVIGYFWVVVGSMVGVWISVAAKRKTVMFEELPDILGDKYFEPIIRVSFVLLLACVFALFIELQLMTIIIGNVNLYDFSTEDPALGEINVALLLGLIAGISERALSIRILDQARRVLSNDK